MIGHYENKVINWFVYFWKYTHRNLSLENWTLSSITNRICVRM